MLVDDDDQQLTERELEIVFSECPDDADGIKLLGSPADEKVRTLYPDLGNFLQLTSDAAGGIEFPDSMVLNLLMKDSDMKFGNWKKTKAHLG